MLKERMKRCSGFVVVLYKGFRTLWVVLRWGRLLGLEVGFLEWFLSRDWMRGDSFWEVGEYYKYGIFIDRFISLEIFGV